MRGYLVKPMPDSGDFYVVWSDIVEAPLAFGPRAYLEGQGMTADQFDRADRTGSSAIWPSLRDPYLRFGESMIYMQRGVLPRVNLTAACDRLGVDENDRITDLLTPFEDEDEVRP